MELFLKITLGVCMAMMVGIAVYLLVDIRRRLALRSVYSSDIRDYRFACALLKIYYKRALIRSPYLSKILGKVSPRADALLVLRGGIVVITVLDKPGFYSTPYDNDWTLINKDKSERIENTLKNSKEYLYALDSLLLKSGIECKNIYSIVLLSDDHAAFDPLYADGVLTGDMLIPYCKKVSSMPSLSMKKRREIKEIILRNHKMCKSYIEKNVYDPTSSLTQGEK